MGAGPGDNVGVSMKGLPKGNMPRDGDIMVKKSDTEFKACETFVVQAMVLDHPGQLRVGYTPTCYVRTSHVACRLMEIRFKTGEGLSRVAMLEGSVVCMIGKVTKVNFVDDSKKEARARVLAADPALL